MKLLNAEETIIKKSKFIGILYKVDSVDEVDEIISSLYVLSSWEKINFHGN